jgi:hypothetical protein
MSGRKNRRVHRKRGKKLRRNKKEKFVGKEYSKRRNYRKFRRR